jgi:hypothetical protein
MTTGMRTFWAWIITKFWWLWSANVLAAFLVLFVFILGWKHESITAPNLPAWCIILSIVPALLLGTFWIRSARGPDIAIAILLLIPLTSILWVGGSILLGILSLIVALIAHLFGHGRVN